MKHTVLQKKNHAANNDDKDRCCTFMARIEYPSSFILYFRINKKN